MLLTTPPPRPSPTLTCRACKLARSSFWRLARRLPDERPVGDPALCPRCQATRPGSPQATVFVACYTPVGETPPAPT